MSKPVSILGFRYFDERESQILYQRVLRDDPTKAQVRQNVTWEEIRNVVSPSSSPTMCRLEGCSHRSVDRLEASASRRLHHLRSCTGIGLWLLCAKSDIRLRIQGSRVQRHVLGRILAALVHQLVLGMGKVSSSYQLFCVANRLFSDRMRARGPMIVLGFVIGLAFNASFRKLLLNQFVLTPL